MEEQTLHTIDVCGFSINFYLSRAIEKNKPIIFILHGQGFNEQPAKFRSPTWNVVCPIDNFGTENLGSWFIGYKECKFWLDAMPMILAMVREITGTGRLYFWGSSMGGYGALLHGYKLNARAIYANIPQTVLLGSKYALNGASKYFEPLVNGVEDPYNDLKKIICKRNSTKIYLCFNQLEGSDYFSEQGLNFIQHLHSFKQHMYVEIRPLSSHGKNHGISETINLFKKFDC